MGDRIGSRFAWVAAAQMLAAGAIFAHSYGPDPRYTGAPGDSQIACTSCHAGTALNGGKGSVKIVVPFTKYKPGASHRITVQVADPEQKVWGFQLTARLAGNPANGQAGDLAPIDGKTQVLCDDGKSKPCAANALVQFIEHTTEGSRPGTPNGASFEFDWTAPAADAGKVTLYVAGNAGNANGRNTGDHIYTASLELEAEAATPAIVLGPYVARTLVDSTADANLGAPWGIALGASGPLRVANAGTGLVTGYDGSGAVSATVLRIPNPAAAGGNSAPTGLVFHAGPGFEVAAGKPATLLAATRAGVIAGWNAEVDAGAAKIVVDNSGAAADYTGLALGVTEAGPVLYAANFAGGSIDAFDAAFRPLTTSGGFVDPNLPAGYAPFNIQRIGRKLYVTYANKAGTGTGYVNVFDFAGNLVRRLAAEGALNAPWGLAPAPGFFGEASGTLLVANTGDGRVLAFDAFTGEALGALTGTDGKPLVIEGLAGLAFGNGRDGGDANTLYFTARGLFGSIAAGQ